MSASKTTNFGYRGASCTRALPNASRRESPLVPMSSGPPPGSAAVVMADVLPVASIQVSFYIVLGNTQFAQCGDQLFVAEFYAAMPERRCLHERDASTLESVRDNHGGLDGGVFCFGEGGIDLLEIMSIDFDYVPAERIPLGA